MRVTLRCNAKPFGRDAGARDQRPSDSVLALGDGPNTVQCPRCSRRLTITVVVGDVVERPPEQVARTRRDRRQAIAIYLPMLAACVWLAIAPWGSLAHVLAWVGGPWALLVLIGTAVPEGPLYRCTASLEATTHFLLDATGVSTNCVTAEAKRPDRAVPRAQPAAEVRRPERGTPHAQAADERGIAKQAVLQHLGADRIVATGKFQRLVTVKYVKGTETFWAIVHWCGHPLNWSDVRQSDGAVVCELRCPACGWGGLTDPILLDAPLIGYQGLYDSLGNRIGGRRT